MFQLARQIKDPVNLSIGQPVYFPVPEPIKRAMIEAIEANQTGYTLTEGIPPLPAEKLQAAIDQQFGHSDRKVMVCSGTSGGLALALLGLVNPGEEGDLPRPLSCDVSRRQSLWPGERQFAFRLIRISDCLIEKIAAAITPRTKMILLNSPGNPTGVCYTREELRQVAELAAGEQHLPGVRR
jgi:aspartate aminotransferase/aminotransferase